MGDFLKLAIVLTIVSVTAALAIAFTNTKTRDRILEQQQIAEKNALQQIMPSKSVISELHSNSTACPSKYWCAKKGNLNVYAFKIASRGYAGDIHYLVSISSDGKIVGMTILDQSETPGLGARVSESISSKFVWNGLFGQKEEGLRWFTEQFIGIDINKDISIDKTTGEWHKLDNKERSDLLAKNKITAITGSTISTRAITIGLEKQARAYLSALQGS
ncbi:MAG TPA: FMN-binding protein [Chitinispirillaceae bacterium]|nr:FMN-binding protein [Chitinispirillaceae bacterium]